MNNKRSKTSPDSIRKWLNTQKLSFKEESDHFQLNCPLCTDTRMRLGITKVPNEKRKVEIGGWNCFNCQSNGKKFISFEYAIHQKNKTKFKTKDTINKEDPDGDNEKKSTLPANFHLKFIKVLDKENCGVRDYLLNERKLSEKCLRYFKIGARRVFEFKGKNGKIRKFNLGDHVVIPYIQDGKCVNIKYRSLNPNVKKDEKWRREKGGMTALLNDAVIDNFDYDELILTEAEIDMMSVWTMGFKNVVGFTAGAGSFKQAWYERMLRFKKIYIVFDRDEAGQEGALKVAKRLGLNRCFNVTLPEDVKDANDFLKKYSKEEFTGLLQKATQFEVPSVMSLKNVLDTVYKKRFIFKDESVTGYPFPFKSLQAKTGNMKEGHFIILAARPKVGKTTMALNLCRKVASKKTPTFIYSCEMNLDTLGDKLVMQVAPNVESIDNIKESDFKFARNKLPLHSMHMFQPVTVADLEREAICEKIRETVTRYGIKIVIFDNLHFATRSEDEAVAIGKLTQAFKLLAEELRIVFFAITHPRKGDNNKKLTPDDLKGSSSIFQDADLVILMNRESINHEDLTDEEKNFYTGTLSPRTELDVIGRWTSGGHTEMYFNEHRGVFKDEGMDFEKMKEITMQRKDRKKPKDG